MKSVILSSAGLRNLVHNQNSDEEFTFLIGNKEIKMKNIFAEFISPYVSQIHQVDPTINYIQFPNKNSTTNQVKSNILTKITDEVISQFKSISEGSKIEITETQSYELQIISILIQNKELFSKLDELFQKNVEKEEYSENKIKENIEFLSFIDESIENPEIFDGIKSIEYIASNFYRIEENKINELPKSIFYSIIKNDKLTISNEDQLLDMINKYFCSEEETNENDVNINDFYEEINFNFLSESKFKEFIEKFDANEMTKSLWNKFKQCFYVYKNSTKCDEKNNHRYKQNNNNIKIEYDGNSSNALNGIINHLTKEAGGNLNDKGIVIATSSSICGDSHLPKFAMDFDINSNYFHTNNEEHSWLQYDFKERKICPTHYSIRSRRSESHAPKNWIIEGSNDAKNWKTLDSRQGINGLHNGNTVLTFDIKSQPNNNESFQYLRIQQTSTNTSGYHYFLFSALEFFGTLIE